MLLQTERLSNALSQMGSNSIAVCLDAVVVRQVNLMSSLCLFDHHTESGLANAIGLFFATALSIAEVMTSDWE